MISVNNLSKQYGGHVLFNEVSFTIHPGERIGLLGRNGYGKSTLVRLIVGEEDVDEGEIVIPKQYTFGYVSQHIDFTKDTVLAESCLGLSDETQTDVWKVEKVLSGLGFSDNDFLRHPGEFSGGYQVRINLAKVLVSEPHLLILDEPTNFLDIVSIRWLERFLKNWEGELLVISHDRTFMDSVTTHVMGIHRQKIKKMSGSSGDYYAYIDQQEAVYEKERLNLEKKRKHAMQFVDKFRAKARQAGMAQSRLKMIEKMEVKEKLENEKVLSFSFAEAPFPAKHVLAVEHLCFSYDHTKPYLLQDVSLTLEAYDKVCIVGRNGAGKTTLLKLLSGHLTPDSGKIYFHPRAIPGYFEQANTVELTAEYTIEEELMSSGPTVSRQLARNVCGAMMFSGDAALKKISVLSGGEKSRVLLGKLLLSETNVLLLDEPTHHLDMQACEAMSDAVRRFSGGVIVVTHDECFLHTVATKLIVFYGDRIEVFPGTYAEFLERGGWGECDELLLNNGVPEKSSHNRTRMSKQERAAFVAERAKVLKPLEKELQRVEGRIEELEDCLADESEQLVAASYTQDREIIAKLSKSMANHRETIDRLYEQLDDLSQEYEKKSAMFQDT